MKMVAKAKSKLIKKEQTLREAGEIVDAVQEEARLIRREREKILNKISRIKQKVASLRVEKYPASTHRQTILQQCHIKSMKLPLLSGSLQEAVVSDETARRYPTERAQSSLIPIFG
ncbi:hypothetical protein E2C01_091805 [Portunus trituberculatus]|uniref:Uncharacterized protein n=1 Tax=Portunus trituberculatus TaxID=210409 RepID=A0A5B7JK01_PORTR|nr:hypothetical protein [Portunus trituberculatus]